ncbi:MAG TPA: HAMP domain-containing sensor histidine kinase [Clostridia bacterium]|nr:HAMP domain-containing sensor histidine kinase [Clostridia bacterium]
MISFFVKYFRDKIMAKIFISYSTACLFGAAAFYKLVPYLLSYAPGYSYIDELHGLGYTGQFVTIVLLALLIGYLIIFFCLRGVKEIEASLSNSKSDIPEHLLVMKRKLLNLPYQLYILQVAVPAVIIILVVLPIFIIQKASFLVFFRLFILVISFATLVSIITLVISRSSLKRLLLKFEPDVNIEGIRLPLVFKLFLQILPVFIVAISITSLSGYANNIEDKGDLISEGYMAALNETFSDFKAEELSPDRIRELLYNVRHVGSSQDMRFIIAPDKSIITSDNEELGGYFLEYLWELSLQNGGYVYDVTKEIRGVISNIRGSDGNYIVGIRFDVTSTELVGFYAISFTFILLLCSTVLYFLSKEMSEDILTVANNLNEIASGEYITFDRKLPVSSNDEIADLVFAFNKIQALVQNHIKQIKENHEVLIQQERMVSLGQLIGGIAHSLKTPISTASDAAFCIENLANEYDQSIDIDTVTGEDHHSIAGEIKVNVKDLKDALEYINTTISMVKNHSINLDRPTDGKFTIKNLTKGINILMSNELKRNGCKLDIHTNMSDCDEINGDIEYLIQVMNVLISNAIQAYATGNGQIYLFIMKYGQSIEIVVQDFGMGIPPDIKDKIFNRMVTTKGNKGTGIGLYISNSIIKTKFNGSLSFVSEEGKGTEFCITLPANRETNYEN